MSRSWKPTAPVQPSLPPRATASRGSIVVRVLHAWRSLPPERRLAATAAIALFFTLFLNWYQETVIAGSQKAGAARSGVALTSASVSLTGWEAFSFVEAAVLLVAVGVLVLLFTRAEGRAFHVPGGDGGVITAAGFWTCVLIVWRIFDKEGTTGHNQFATTSGIDWGIFVALAVAGLLTYAGSRIRRAADPEPPLPDDPNPVARFDGAPAGTRSGRSGAPAGARSGRSGAPAGARPGRSGAPAHDGDTAAERRRRPSTGRGGARPRTAPPDWDEVDADDPTAVAVEPRPERAHVEDEPPAANPQRESRGPTPALSRREIQEIEIAEPPPSTLRRARPAPYRKPSELRGAGGPSPREVDENPTLPDHPRHHDDD